MACVLPGGVRAADGGACGDVGTGPGLLRQVFWVWPGLNLSLAPSSTQTPKLEAVAISSLPLRDGVFCTASLGVHHGRHLVIGLGTPLLVNGHLLGLAGIIYAGTPLGKGSPGALTAFCSFEASSSF